MSSMGGKGNLDKASHVIFHWKTGQSGKYKIYFRKFQIIF